MKYVIVFLITYATLSSVTFGINPDNTVLQNQLVFLLMSLPVTVYLIATDLHATPVSKPKRGVL